MSRDKESAPLLHFFNSFPQEHLVEDGVPAALQAFETSILLMAMGRWPAITALIWQACEVFLARKYTKPDESKEKRNLPNSVTLQKRFFETGQISKPLNSKAHKLRKLRNRIFHEGYSPKDNAECVETFFNGGVPYLQALIKDACNIEIFDVLEKDPGAQWLWKMYKETRHVLNKKLEKRGEVGSALFFLKLASAKINAMDGKSHSSLSPYNQVAAIFEEHFQDLEFDVEAIKRKNMLEILSPYDGIDDGYLLPDVKCPVCLKESILAKIDWIEVEAGYRLQDIPLLGCYECEYFVNDVDLIDIFFRQQLSEEQIAQLEKDNTDCYVG